MSETVLLGGSSHLGATVVVGEARIEKPMLGRYQVEKELGKGAMGVVYLGKDPKIGRAVAIKTMALSQEFAGDELIDARERFFQVLLVSVPVPRDVVAQLLLDVGGRAGLARGRGGRGRAAGDWLELRGAVHDRLEGHLGGVDGGHVRDPGLDRRLLRLGERECESVFVLLEFFGVGIVDD